jgi:lipopolysaccharide transport protein LptA
MARTCRNYAARLLGWALPALVSGTVAAALPDFSGLPVTVDAASSEVDYKTNTVVFKDVVISQGAMRVQAEHARATGLNFANSRWNFEGNVRIDAEERGNLRSDQAVVEFRDNHIARATITGKPAEFEQRRANSDQIARGHADEIFYDVSDGTVRLSDEAWLSDGQNEISGPLLVYNIREQQIQAVAAPNATAGADQRVHISIAPHAGAGASGKPEPPKAEPAKPEAPKPDAAKPAPKPAAASADSAPKS